MTLFLLPCSADQFCDVAVQAVTPAVGGPTGEWSSGGGEGGGEVGGDRRN